MSLWQQLYGVSSKLYCTKGDFFGVEKSDWQKEIVWPNLMRRKLDYCEMYVLWGYMGNNNP